MISVGEAKGLLAIDHRTSIIDASTDGVVVLCVFVRRRKRVRKRSINSQETDRTGSPIHFAQAKPKPTVSTKVSEEKWVKKRKVMFFYCFLTCTICTSVSSEAASIPHLLCQPIPPPIRRFGTHLRLAFAPPFPHFPVLSLGKFRGVGAITIFDEGGIDNRQHNIDSVVLVGKRHKMGVALAHAPFWP